MIKAVMNFPVISGKEGFCHPDEGGIFKFKLKSQEYGVKPEACSLIKELLKGAEIRFLLRRNDRYARILINTNFNL